VTTPREEQPPTPATGPSLSTAPPRSRWQLPFGRVPGHVGPARTSTLVLAILFVAIFALWLYVRPVSAQIGSAGGTDSGGGSGSGAAVRTTTSSTPTPSATPTPTATRTRSTAPPRSSSSAPSPTGSSAPATPSTTAPGSSAPSTGAATTQSIPLLPPSTTAPTS